MYNGTGIFYNWMMNGYVDEYLIQILGYYFWSKLFWTGDYAILF